MDEDKFARYDELLLKTALAEMSDVVHCARKSCQAPVIVEKVQGRLLQSLSLRARRGQAHPYTPSSLCTPGLAAGLV